jgi:hypothetical protein
MAFYIINRSDCPSHRPKQSEHNRRQFPDVREAFGKATDAAHQSKSDCSSSPGDCLAAPESHQHGPSQSRFLSRNHSDVQQRRSPYLEVLFLSYFPSFAYLSASLNQIEKKTNTVIIAETLE